MEPGSEAADLWVQTVRGASSLGVQEASRALETFCQDFAPVFRRSETRRYSHLYTLGLLSDLGRKSIEPAKFPGWDPPDFLIGIQGSGVAQPIIVPPNIHSSRGRWVGKGGLWHAFRKFNV